MKENYFDYERQPGKELAKIEYENGEPVISIVVPFYNDKQYINQSVNAILNQTFSLFELLIIDDGSKDEESLKELEKIEKSDSRIKVYHKQNEGLSATRDYGASVASAKTKYLVFCDSDDLMDKTFLECAYWTLETNKKASWAYSDSVGFENIEYLWNKWFDSERMKKINDLVENCMIRKEAFEEVNGYELREKAVNEDWNFWLKLIAKGRFPVRMNYYGIWYRRKKEGELAKSRENKERALEIIRNTAKTIKKPVKAIQYPKQDYDWDGIIENVDGIKYTCAKCNGKINILMIIPWMVTGGADKFNLDLISRLDKNKFNIIILSTQPSFNEYRQTFEKYATIYDLTSFLDRKYWTAFVNYIIKKENINLVFNTNARFGYAVLPYIKANYPELPIVDYVHMEEWYNRNGGYSRDSSAVASIIDKTLVCNKNSEKILIDYFKRNSKDIDTVYIGVNEKEYNPEEYNKKELFKKYNIEDKGRYIIGYICRIAEQKRPKLFIQIVKELKQTRNDFLVVVAGEGYMLNQIKQETKKFGLENNIKFLGNVLNTKEVYAMCDMTVNCSIKEGLALTSYESLAMGVPVVSSDVGGQKELIDSTVGEIVPCMQKETEIMNFKYKKEEIQNYVTAINKVLKNLNTYKNNCRKKISNGFTIDQMSENMTRIFEEIAKNPNVEKIENGKSLSRCLDIAKEVINLYYETSKLEYSWLCDEYNREFGLRTSIQRSILKERLWKIPLWRKFIEVLQKTGIMKIVKKILKREE